MTNEMAEIVSKEDFKKTSDEIAEENINPFEAGIMASLEEAEAGDEIEPEAPKNVELIKNKDGQMFIKAKYGWQELTVANQLYVVQAIVNNLNEIENK